ncbi:MAG: lipoyl(octanoyl) transferase LipB [Bacteroidales bacterium]
MKKLILEEWGRIDYPQAWMRQKELFETALQLKKGSLPVPNRWIFCEHNPVITLGKSGKQENLLLTPELLEQRGVLYQEIDRGGDVTYHGPGQLVGYPILDLENFQIGLRRYIWLLEETIIRTIATYGLLGKRIEGASGVWLDAESAYPRKICAIGVKSSRFLTMHGFALNVNTDLSYFTLINPCGFTTKGVTSLEHELGRKTDMEEVQERVFRIASELFA